MTNTSRKMGTFDFGTFSQIRVASESLRKQRLNSASRSPCCSSSGGSNAYVDENVISSSHISKATSRTMSEEKSATSKTGEVIHKVLDHTILDMSPYGTNIDGAPRLDGKMAQGIANATVLDTSPHGTNVGTFASSVGQPHVFSPCISSSFIQMDSLVSTVRKWGSPNRPSTKCSGISKSGTKCSFTINPCQSSSCSAFSESIL